jgi:hypothetical protein
MDLETGGDGCGSVRACVLRPLRRALDVADRVGLPLTLFPDATGLAAISARGEDDDRSAVDDVVRALGDAARRGHAVELHLHPQWWEAERHRGAWRLAAPDDLGALPENDRIRVVDAGIRWVEAVAGTRPVAFRAGAWKTSPPAPVYGLLADRGLRIDSTVMPGRWGAGFDFRTAPSDRRRWRFRSDPRLPGDGPWTEIAIATAPLPTSAAWWGRARRLARGWRSPGCAIRGARRPTRGPAALDPCAWPLGALLRIAESARDRSADPLVVIAHTKTLVAGAEAAFEGLRRALPEPPGLLRDAG